MLVARAVVKQVPLLHGALDVLQRDRALARESRGRLESVERHPSVAARDLEQGVEGVISDTSLQLLQPPLHDIFQLLAVQLLQAEDAASRE